MTQTAEGSGSVRLRGVGVIDTRDGSLTRDQDIVIADGRIAAIGNTDPARTDGVDLSGKYVVPGFLDMHAHPLGDGDPTGTLNLMLAKGVTGFRQMSGSAKMLQQRRSGKLRMPTASPAVLAMPGAILTPFNAGTHNAARATVREQHAAGADFIKVGLVSPSVFFAAQAEARRLNIPILGHLPTGIDTVEASRGGMKSIEHLGPGPTLVAACSPEKSGLLSVLAGRAVKGPPFRVPLADRLLLPLLRKAIRNPYAWRGAKDVAVLRRAIDTFSEELAEQMADHFVADGTWHVPTLIRECSCKRCDATEFREDPNHRYVGEKTLKQWHESGRRFDKLPAAVRDTLSESYDLNLVLTKVFDNVGVRILAGSDCTGAAWEVPGYALHQEFDALAHAGLSPLRVLQATTLSAADYLGATDTMGTVDVGKNADLVVLEANPLDSAHNLHGVRAVVRAGRYYSDIDLDELQQHVAARRSAK